MRKINLLLYFQKQAFAEGIALRTSHRKIDTYRNFFRSAHAMGFDIYIGSQEGGYKGDRVFTNLYKYENNTFTPVSIAVKMDVIFDRSSSKNIIPQDIAPIVFNSPDFKTFCESKSLTYESLHAYMPQSIVVENTDQMNTAITSMQSLEKIVLKPVHGMKGIGVFINTPQALHAQNILIDQPYIVQEFVNTSKGIPNITATLHDIRMIIINSTCVLASMRTPAQGSYLANVAQGGSIQEIPVSQLPDSVLSELANVQEIIKNRFGNPFYSIDFGIHKDGKLYVFELNDRIDFPDSTMEHAPFFAQELATALYIFSQDRLDADGA